MDLSTNVSAAVKLLPGRQMRPIKWSDDPDIPQYWSDWQSKNFLCQNQMIIPNDADMSDGSDNYHHINTYVQCMLFHNFNGGGSARD